jgi:hypothetical protein
MSRNNVDFPFAVAFPPQAMTNVLAEWLSMHEVKQAYPASRHHPPSFCILRLVYPPSLLHRQNLLRGHVFVNCSPTRSPFSPFAVDHSLRSRPALTSLLSLTLSLSTTFPVFIYNLNATRSASFSASKFHTFSIPLSAAYSFTPPLMSTDVQPSSCRIPRNPSHLHADCIRRDRKKYAHVTFFNGALRSRLPSKNAS